MAKGIFKTFSNIKVKRFLFFLVLASILWILTKFGKDFTSSIVASINYENLPETAVLADSVPQEIKFDLTANGFEILFHKFKKPVMNIDVSEFYIKNKNEFAVAQQDMIRGLEGNFNKSMEIKNLTPDPLVVDLEPIIRKKVVVIANKEIEFRKGFAGVGDYKIEPNTIHISGPKVKLETIDTVFTEKLSLKKVDSDISEVLEIKSPADEIVLIEPSEVQFDWAVDEFSEGKFTIPVEVINLPPGQELKLRPQQISVTFLTGIETFSEVSKDHFRVVCDYSKRNDKEGFLVPELVKKPKEAVNVSLKPKKIEYLIFKN